MNKIYFISLILLSACIDSTPMEYYDQDASVDASVDAALDSSVDDEEDAGDAEVDSGPVHAICPDTVRMQFKRSSGNCVDGYEMNFSFKEVHVLDTAENPCSGYMYKLGDAPNCDYTFDYVCGGYGHIVGSFYLTHDRGVLGTAQGFISGQCSSTYDMIEILE